MEIHDQTVKETDQNLTYKSRLIAFCHPNSSIRSKEVQEMALHAGWSKKVYV
jgi:hypothetical protein